MTFTGLSESSRQLLAIVALQGIEINVFHRHRQVRVTVIATTSPGLADTLPICRLVACAPKAGSFHEGLQTINGVAIARLPILPDAAGHEAENMAGQALDANPG